MRTMGAREANQRFSELLREVEKGDEVTITRHGRPVARLAPARPTRAAAVERRKAMAKMIDLMRQGIDLGGRRYSRDEMHES